jgi:hypothetical protein
MERIQPMEVGLTFKKSPVKSGKKLVTDGRNTPPVITAYEV